jgi:protein disulfide-isomerase A1
LSQAKFQFDDGVLVLNDDNFDDALKTYDVMMVEFYAPWCGHCKELAPKYGKLATKLKGNAKPIMLAKVDATKAEKTGDRFKIDSYPRLLSFTKGDGGKGVTYKNKPDTPEIEEYMKGVRAKTPFKPPVKSLKDVAAAKKFEKSYVGVVGIFDKKSGPEYAAFAALSIVQAHRKHVKFAVSTASEVAEHYNVKAPAVLLVKAFDDKRSDISADVLTKVDKLSTAVEEASRETVCNLDNEKKSDCKAQDPVMILIYRTKEDKEVVKLFEETAAANKSPQLAFGKMSKSHTAVGDFFDIDADELPTLVVIKQGGIYSGAVMKHYLDKNENPEITAEVIEESLQAFQMGEWEAVFKTQDPIDDEDTNVKQIVSMDFAERVVEDAGKDVLLEFYAPWCSMCKKLDPLYNQLGEIYADIDSVVIAKMDATANELHHPGIIVEGYPTVFFFPANQRPKVVVFKEWQEMDPEKMKAWIKENVGVEYDINKYRSYEKLAAAKEEEQKMSGEEGQSEEPKDDSNDNVKFVVAKTFKERVLDSSTPWLIDFYAPWCGHCKTLMPKIQQLGDAMAKAGGKTLIGKCDLTANDMASLHPAVTAEGRGYPMLMYFHADKTMDPLYYEGPKYVDDMEAYLNGGFEESSTGRKLKSDEEMDDAAADLKTLVGSDFKRRVMKTDAPAIIEFYAPWCGMCKKMLPEFEKLAVHFKGKVLVAKMDVTANEVDHEKVEVDAYPTIFYFPGDDKKNPTKFSGQRDFEGLRDYVQEQLDGEDEEIGEDEL